MSDKWSDRMNPVLLKELRQSLHNRWPLGAMGLMLAGLWVLLLIMQLTALKNNNSTLGGFFVAMVFVALGLAGAVVCVFTPMMRFCRERENPDLDFSRTTTLSPGELVRGKLLSSAVMTVFIFSLVMPFLVIAYFLRGVSLLQIGVSMLGTACGIMVMSSMGLVLGSSGKRKVSGALAIYLLFQNLYGLGLGIFVAGMRGMNGTFMAVLPWVLGLLVFFFCYVMTVAVISPVSSNRLHACRIFLLITGLILPWLIAAFFVKEAYGGVIVLAGYAAALAPIAVERLEPGKRVLRRCPLSLPGRFFYFITSSGAYGGITLAAILLVNLLAGFTVFEVDWKPIHLAAYAFGYIALVLFLRKWVRKGIGLSLLFAVIIPFFIPIVIFQERLWEPWYCEIFAGAALLLVMPRIVRAFRAMRRDDAVPAEAAAEEKIPAEEAEPEVMPEKSVKRKELFTGELWSAWCAKILRQGIHSKVFFGTLAGVIGMDMLIAGDCLWWNRWGNDEFAPWLIFLPLLVGTGALGSSFPGCYTAIAVSRITENRTHFKDFSLFNPGEVIRGMMGSYTIFFLLLLAAAIPGYLVMWTCITGLRNGFVCGVVLAYTLPLLAGIGAGSSKVIRWDVIIGVISTFCVLFCHDISLWDRVLYAAVLKLCFILVWGGNIDERPYSRELLPRLGQLILLPLSWYFYKTYPKEEWVALLPVCVALAGSVYSAGAGALWNRSRQRHELRRHPVASLFGSTSSPLGWIWSTLLAVIYLVWFYRADDNNNTFMLVVGFMIWCGGALISGVTECSVADDEQVLRNRRRYRYESFALLLLIVPVALMIVTLILAVSWERENLPLSFFSAVFGIGGLGVAGATLRRMLRWLKKGGLLR